MSVSISRDSYKLFVSLFFKVTLVRIVFDYVFITQIATIYGYNGYFYDFNLMRSIVSWLMMYSLLPVVVRCIRKPCFSNLVLYAIYLINYIPATIMVSFMHPEFAVYLYLYYLLLFAVTFEIKLRITKRSHHYMTKRSIYMLAALFSVVVPFVWLYYARGRIQLGFDDVYEARLEARGYGIPMVFRYIFASMKVVIPVCVVWALKNKNRGIAIALTIVQLISFFVDGTKSTVFSIFVSIAGYYYLNKNEDRIRYFPDVLACIGLLSIAEYKIRHTFMITHLFIRRVMFVPNMLNFRYYEFFSEHEPDYFRASILRLFGFQSPYGSVARTIGKYFSGSDDLAANNGLFSDAIANLGVVGVVIMPLAVLLILKTLDAVSEDIDLASRIAAVVPFTVAVISTSYFRLFLTHGMVALFMIFYFIPRKIDHELQHGTGHYP